MYVTDKDLLLCDLAETYNIYDYRQLPLTKVAAFSVGLRENSRIKQKVNGISTSTETLLMATIADRLGLILTALTGQDSPPSIAKSILGISDDKESNVKAYDSVEDFMEERYGGQNGIRNNTC